MEIKEIDCGVCIDNFRASGVREGGYGVALIVNESPCETAAVYTTSNLKAAPVLVTKEKIMKGRLQAVIANSGNANACVRDGVDDAKRMCEIAGRELDLNPGNIGVASTGIIGRRLDMDLIERLTGKAATELSTGGGGDAARAIMTTDTLDKQLSFEYKGIKIGGICKGAGMIAPNLATMLCFLTTNADLSRSELQDSLNKVVEDSFNMLVVDNDMSTNDMVLLMSNGGVKCELNDFGFLLDYITKGFVKLMAFDAEGATKFLEVELLGALDRDSARAGAKSIVSSSLVKTALYGENPNWGRIAAAVGVVTEFDLMKFDLVFESGDERAVVVKKGNPGDLERARKILKHKQIKVTVNLNLGEESAVAWGCDLSPEYVKINAEYS
ncbi:MAG: bifunctional glutamate N-acetyltransferase/amino-acid acetyltransferase ArgJ [Candidatus Altiarchaeota archaeon]|nr:bifunctional glutamate N-acetyltransferase/amino-acid acetyltransferase ArgJ [Candidatus Altiarchaeota archaeon]